MKIILRRIALLAELLAVGTAVAFIFSGLANAAIFALAWRLNYFVIATPSDVIMSGFIFALLILVVSIPVAAGIMTLWLFIAARRERLQAEAEAEALDAAVEEDAKRIFGEDYDKLERGFTRVIASAQRTHWLATVVAGVVSIVSGLVAFYGAFLTEVRPAPPAQGEQGQPDRFSYATGLRIAPDADANADCWAAPVLWMGSDRLVLGCQAGVRVVTLSDEMILQTADLRVPSRQGFLLQRRNDAAHDQVMEQLTREIGREVSRRLEAGQPLEQVVAEVEIPAALLSDKTKADAPTNVVQNHVPGRPAVQPPLAAR